MSGSWSLDRPMDRKTISNHDCERSAARTCERLNCADRIDVHSPATRHVCASAANNPEFKRSIRVRATSTNRPHPSMSSTYMVRACLGCRPHRKHQRGDTDQHASTRRCRMAAKVQDPWCNDQPGTQDGADPFLPDAEGKQSRHSHHDMMAPTMCAFSAASLLCSIAERPRRVRNSWSPSRTFSESPVACNVLLCIHCQPPSVDIANPHEENSPQYI